VRRRVARIDGEGAPERLDGLIDVFDTAIEAV